MPMDSSRNVTTGIGLLSKAVLQAKKRGHLLWGFRKSGIEHRRNRSLRESHISMGYTTCGLQVEGLTVASGMREYGLTVTGE